MSKRILKRYSGAFCSLAIASIIVIILACAGGDDDLRTYFTPEIIHSKAYTPFFRSIHAGKSDEFLYHFEYSEDWDSTISNSLNNFNEINRKEWSAFFKEKVISKDLKELLYQYSLKQIDSLLFFMKNPAYPLSQNLRSNSISKLNSRATKDFLTYLKYAKNCEPIAIHPFRANDEDYSWRYSKEENIRRNRAKDSATQAILNTIPKLLFSGQKAFATSTDNFIRQRYLFQIVRLYFLSGEYDTCYNFFKQNESAFKTNNSIKYRAMGYAAGALYKMKRYAEANYMYSLAYDGCDEMKIQAYLSFHPMEDTDWNKSLVLAKNKRQKEVLWHLLGIYVDPLRAMKEIYALDPKSDLLDLLVVRSINIAEETLMPLEEYEPTNETYSIFPDLLRFIKNTADQGNTLHPYLWNISTGYLLLLKKDYTPAEDYFKKTLANSNSDTLLQNQVRLFRILSKVEQLKTPTPEFEEDISKDLVWMSSDHGVLRRYAAYDYMLQRLSEIYETNGEFVKAECLNPTQRRGEMETNAYTYFSKQNGNIEAMVAYMNKPNKTAFDSFLLSNYPITKKDVSEFQAIKSLYEYNFSQAVVKFKECSGVHDTLLADPFLIHIKDCHDCDFGVPKKITYTKLMFAERMAALEDSVEMDKAGAPIYLFQLGNGYYNMTYYGNSRTLYNSVITSGGLWTEENDLKKFGIIEDDCSKAEECYKKAMELSTDKEFKAKCCFMVAKCEQNGLDYDRGRAQRFHLFDKLQQEYSQTAFYKEAISECGYFRRYVQNVRDSIR